jgi:hypothetical protein
VLEALVGGRRGWGVGAVDGCGVLAHDTGEDGYDGAARGGIQCNTSTVLCCVGVFSGCWVVHVGWAG